MKKAIFLAVLAFVFAFTVNNVEANGCSFGRTLFVGSRGEDVRCLQQYLISSGHSYSGADGVFGQMTRQSVANWQSSNGLYASGYFDAQSMDKYRVLSQNTYYGGGSVLGASTIFSSQEALARQRIEDALNKIEEAEDEIDDSNKNTSSAEKDIEDARDDMFEAMREFFIDRDFYKAEDWADSAFKNAEDALDKVDDGGNKQDARDAIEDAENAIDDARDEINEAEDDGEYVGRANDLLDEARDRLDDAEDEYDDKDYDDAQDFAEEAEDLANDAINEVN